jgi:hypothetical protein
MIQFLSVSAKRLHYDTVIVWKATLIYMDDQRREKEEKVESDGHRKSIFVSECNGFPSASPPLDSRPPVLPSPQSTDAWQRGERGSNMQ